MGRAEDLVIGLIALALVPWIGWTLARGLNSGRLPIGRAFVAREERRGPFLFLLLLYIAAAALAAFIAVDLLFGLQLWNGR